jgi:hypothetical protein
VEADSVRGVPCDCAGEGMGVLLEMAITTGVAEAVLSLQEGSK